MKLGKNAAKQAEDYEYRDGDIIFYHLSTGSDLNYKITEYPCKRIVMYHNLPLLNFSEDTVQVRKKHVQTDCGQRNIWHQRQTCVLWIQRTTDRI